MRLIIALNLRKSARNLLLSWIGIYVFRGFDS